jgi:hypothetical protein
MIWEYHKIVSDLCGHNNFCNTPNKMGREQ